MEFYDWNNSDAESSHFGIYIGKYDIDGQMKEHCIIHLIHATVEKKNICFDNLENIPPCRVRLNNSFDEIWMPYKQNQIVEKAISLSTFDRDLVELFNFYTSKKFALFCRYGKCDERILLIRELAIVSGASFGLTGLAIICISAKNIYNENKAIVATATMLPFIGYGIYKAITGSMRKFYFKKKL